ncbi:hypothetical protein LRS74_21845 [Streptomyces sp. LX-29]|uniref:hypothetical protein n=1 Tax=Streptomyces sp. LX-29 TaxID=2900152 RepID=UPI00240CF6EC|nr:hypothetical protein [Streptomyces sp. LX-29]WFB09390.1 hypothetical protein LRS74_21845 [Streptomyces sp. LX-29]
MRPSRFEEHALDLVKNAAGVSGVSRLREAGDDKHPFGLAMTHAGGEARWQFIAESSPGDDYSETEAPVEGEPMAPVPVPEVGARLGPVEAEAWFAALLASGGSREISSIEQWSGRANPRPGHHGLTVRCHSGARIYVRVLGTDS